MLPGMDKNLPVLLSEDMSYGCGLDELGSCTDNGKDLQRYRLMTVSALPSVLCRKSLCKRGSNSYKLLICQVRLNWKAQYALRSRLDHWKNYLPVPISAPPSTNDSWTK